MKYKDKNNKPMLVSFDIDFVIDFISLNLPRLELIFHQMMQKKGIDMIDFVHYMLKEIEFNTNETLYVAIALIEFYKAVAESENTASVI